MLAAVPLLIEAVQAGEFGIVAAGAGLVANEAASFLLYETSAPLVGLAVGAGSIVAAGLARDRARTRPLYNSLLAKFGDVRWRLTRT